MIEKPREMYFMRHSFRILGPDFHFVLVEAIQTNLKFEGAPITILARINHLNRNLLIIVDHNSKMKNEHNKNQQNNKSIQTE